MRYTTIIFAGIICGILTWIILLMAKDVRDAAIHMEQYALRQEYILVNMLTEDEGF